MLTYDDCVGLCGLRPEEIDAIARHEHLPEIVALEMGACLAETPQGRRAVRRMILEDLHDAHRRGDTALAASLQLVLRHVADAHPDRPPPSRGATASRTADRDCREDADCGQNPPRRPGTRAKAAEGPGRKDDPHPRA